MAYEIDQSGKIEDTSKDTVVAICNGEVFSMRVKSKHKRELKLYFRSSKRKRRYPYQVWVVLIFMCIERSQARGRIIIDNEYFGYDNFILNEVYVLLNEKQIKGVHLDIGHIGKSSCAHKLAIKGWRKKVRVDKLITFKNILEILKKD